MCKLFSNEVAEGYSWVGFKGKNKFSLLRIAAAIIGEYVTVMYKIMYKIFVRLLLN